MANLNLSKNFGNSSDYRPYGYVYLEETGTSASGNSSTVYGKLVLKRPYELVSSATRSATLRLNGTDYTFSGTMGGTGDKVLVTKTITVPHSSDGSKSMPYYAKINLSGINWGGTYIPDIETSGNFTLTKLDLYPSASVSLASRTETSLTVRWTSDTAISKVEYSTNGGSSYKTYTSSANAKTGTFTISSLSANTTYSVRVRLTSKSSGLATASSSVSMSTYAYPYANSMPDFSIGNSVTIGVYNPLGRSYTVTMIASDNNEVTTTSSYTGTSVSGFRSTEYVSLLSGSLDSTHSGGTYKIRINFGSHTETRTGGTYSLSSDANRPTPGVITYEDTNNQTFAITGDRSKIIQSRSTPQYTVTGFSAKNGATISSISVKVNGQTIPLTLYDTYAKGGNVVIHSASNVVATATVTDSRGFTATCSVEVQMLAYHEPTAVYSINRQNNFNNETNIYVSASCSDLNGGNSVTADYRAKRSDLTTWSSWTVIPNNQVTVATFDNGHAWDFQVRVTDTVGGTHTYEGISIGKGIPFWFADFQNNSIGINTIPTHQDALEVGGKIYEDGESLSYRYGSLASHWNDYGGFTDGTSISNATWTTTATMDIPEGFCLVLCYFSFQSNSTGQRLMLISSSSSGTSRWVAMGHDYRNAYNGNITNLSCSFIVNQSTAQTVYMRVYQNSGSALTGSARYSVIRLAPYQS